VVSFPQVSPPKPCLCVHFVCLVTGRLLQSTRIQKHFRFPDNVISRWAHAMTPSGDGKWNRRAHLHNKEMCVFSHRRQWKPDHDGVMHSNYFHFTTCSQCYTGEEVWLQPTVSTSWNSASRLRAMRWAAVTLLQYSHTKRRDHHSSSIFTRSRAPFPALPFNDFWFIQHLQENSQYRLLLNEQPAINTTYSYHRNKSEA